MLTTTWTMNGFPFGAASFGRIDDSVRRARGFDAIDIVIIRGFHHESEGLAVSLR